MNTEERPIDQYLDEWLSGYIDGELTQQQRQRVEIHCAENERAQALLEELKALRSEVGNATLSQYGEDKWREQMDETGVQVSRGIGWVLLVISALAIGGIVVFGFLTDPSIPVSMKLLIGGFYGGLAVLLGSVVRQRMIESKTDKYNDVEI
ncbi:MAG: hypothetical protein AAF660_07010 [Pseudomonadota bacterium]